ncbi:DNA polymerase III subunit delta' [Kovacikia minuta CCNUW1]|nr:DNA polymerase III subunit delta' [Kovacikia minuta]UBF29620.1 DNA polymerase III subunit delta' [Kovacikia minuta CCNUW1]
MSPFSPLIGQPQAVELLTQAVTRNRIAPAYLFAGPSGVGRGLAAECFIELLFHRERSNLENSAILRHRILARNHPDLLWVEPTYLHQGKRLSVAEAIAAGIRRKSAPVIRLEQVREIARFLARAPLEAPRSIVVIEQAETMAEGAANGLLKTLEEPGQATLILIAPGVESLLPTLVSRCQRIPFYRLPSEAMAEILQKANQAEILNQREVLHLAQGSPGAAIAHWQQLQEIPPDLLQTLSQPPRSYRAALDLARQIDKTLEPETQRWLIDYLQQTYWQQMVSDSQLTSRLLPIQLLEKARQYLLQSVQPRLVWEVMLVKMVQV